MLMRIVENVNLVIQIVYNVQEHPKPVFSLAKKNKFGLMMHVMTFVKAINMLLKEIILKLITVILKMINVFVKNAMKIVILVLVQIKEIALLVKKIYILKMVNALTNVHQVIIKIQLKKHVIVAIKVVLHVLVQELINARLVITIMKKLMEYVIQKKRKKMKMKIMVKKLLTM